MDRDANAARNLAALAAACPTGTAVAADQAAEAPKPRGADQKTRTTRRGPTAAAGRAGGATLPHGRKKPETVDKPKTQGLGDRTQHSSRNRRVTDIQL